MHLNKKIITGVAAGLMLIALAAGLIAGEKKKAVKRHIANAKVATANAARPVTLSTVKKGSATRQRSYPGTVRAAEESALAFRVGGPLTEVNIQLGQPVKKGDLLMQIDPRDFKDHIQALEAQLAGAEAQQTNAAKNYARFATLFEQAVIPQSDFDAATSAKNTTDAAVKTLKAQLEMARHALEDTALRAPYDGTVTQQLAENNEMIKSGAVVLIYHNIQQLEVTVSVPENEIAQRALSQETPVLISFAAAPGKTAVARLKEWSSAADPLTRTYAVTFAFDAPSDCHILPGMSASVSWTQQNQADPVLTIPAAALNTAADGSNTVWVYNPTEKIAEQRAVTPGPLHGTAEITILSGLAEGEQVVTAGGRLIHANQPLNASIR
jgi:RND family efflux transporter MFP subunit